jgi:hypothetical protein
MDPRVRIILFQMLFVMEYVRTNIGNTLYMNFFNKILFSESFI